MISFQQVSKTFKQHCVLDNFNLDILTGEHIALIGSNGAGKTTLIRCLLGEYIYDGKITVAGYDSHHQRRNVLKHIGFVPQLPPPLKMPVHQLIQFAAGICGNETRNITDISTQLGLNVSEVHHRPFVKLSGGQKQKLLISIALGRNTDILVMDEPAANLDPAARKVFFNLLNERQKNAITLISSHRIDELRGLVNRVLELDNGKIVLDEKLSENQETTQKLYATH
jgi:ABC-2 type transport system ATP-binding protein